LFQNTDTWLMHDNADPLSGWDLKVVEDCSSGTATSDIYGKLFYHLRAVLQAFLSRLSGFQASFRLLQLDASNIPDHVESGTFGRIEVNA
jgi:hypothetical protein